MTLLLWSGIFDSYLETEASFPAFEVLHQMMSTVFLAGNETCRNHPSQNAALEIVGPWTLYLEDRKRLWDRDIRLDFGVFWIYLRMVWLWGIYDLYRPPLVDMDNLLFLALDPYVDDDLIVVWPRSVCQIEQAKVLVYTLATCHQSWHCGSKHTCFRFLNNCGFRLV